MNIQNTENSQREVDNAEDILSVTAMDELSEIIAEATPHCASAIAEDVLSQIDALSVVTEFAISAETPKEVVQAVLSPAAEVELEAVLASFPMADEHQQPSRHKQLAKLYEEGKERHAEEIERNKREGHIAQMMDTIDAHRKTPEGKAQRKLSRKEKRHQKAKEEGRVIKERRTFANDEERQKAQKTGAARSAKFRSNIPVSEQSAARQQRRQNAKQREKDADEAKLQAIKDNPFA